MTKRAAGQPATAAVKCVANSDLHQMCPPVRLLEWRRERSSPRAGSPTFDAAVSLASRWER
jgi:hypothetical protein